MSWIDYALISFVVCTGLLWLILRQRNLIVKDVVISVVITAYCIATFTILTFFKQLSWALPVALIAIMVILTTLRNNTRFETWLNRRIKLP